MPTLSTPLIIGIAGGSGSGKTTMAHSILDAIGEDRIAFLPHDAYYRDQSSKSFEERLQVNYDHPDSLETELLIKHIQALKRGEAVDLPVYDFKIHTRADRVQHVLPKPIILVEGILIFVEPKLRNLCSMKLFVDTNKSLLSHILCLIIITAQTIGQREYLFLVTLHDNSKSISVTIQTKRY